MVQRDAERSLGHSWELLSNYCGENVALNIHVAVKLKRSHSRSHSELLRSSAFAAGCLQPHQTAATMWLLATTWTRLQNEL